MQLHLTARPTLYKKKFPKKIRVIHKVQPLGPNFKTTNQFTQVVITLERMKEASSNNSIESNKEKYATTSDSKYLIIKTLIQPSYPLTNYYYHKLTEKPKYSN